MFDIPGRTNGLSFSFFTGNWSFSFVQIFSLTDERFWTLENIKERTNRLADGQIWIDEQMIQNFRLHFDVKSGFISSSDLFKEKIK
ncbi:unnamed protein product [Rhizophagus irregularis]|uniref:Uncharacterized protein n=1 Tax=Rhizophagus irregularis TaxID=588596 RepID=A0A915Z1C0_9GLOM|nr:unnamed protein product [Rhizophagus irregularis]CAB5358384.1 unnamed protein product [Rhizophagus irregularis]